MLKELLARLISKIEVPFKRKVCFDEINYVRCSINPLDFIFTGRPWALSNLFIRGDFSHIELVMPGGKVLGSRTHGGLKSRSLKSLLETAGWYEVRRWEDLDSVVRGKILHMALDLADDNIPYGWDMGDGGPIHCSELPWRLWRECADYDFQRKGSIIQPEDIRIDTNLIKVLERKRD